MKRKLEIEALEARNLAAATFNPVSSLLSMQPPTQPAQIALVSTAVNGMVGKGLPSMQPAKPVAQTAVLSLPGNSILGMGADVSNSLAFSADWIKGLRPNHNETLVREQRRKRAARFRQTRR